MILTPRWNKSNCLGTSTRRAHYHREATSLSTMRAGFSISGGAKLLSTSWPCDVFIKLIELVMMR
jgi:hypothetical protein